MSATRPALFEFEATLPLVSGTLAGFESGMLLISTIVDDMPLHFGLVDP